MSVGATYLTTLTLNRHNKQITEGDLLWQV